MTVPERASERRTAIQVQHRWPLISGCVAVAAVVLGGALIAIRAYDVVPYSIDDGWMKYLVSRRTPALQQIAEVFDVIGGGLIATIVVPIVGAALLWWRHSRWSAVYFLTALIISSGLVQLIKNTVDRPRPEAILVTSDFGSFPSGHSANAATLATAIGIIVWRTWIWIVGGLYVLLMMLSRNYLGAHWLTDTVGGLVLGIAIAVICWPPFAYRIFAERQARTGA
jgi:membrane-associated phospholipid phosphatase